MLSQALTYLPGQSPGTRQEGVYPILHPTGLKESIAASTSAENCSVLGEVFPSHTIMSLSSTAVVGRMIVDRDDALLAKSLLEAQEVLHASFTCTNTKGKGRADASNDPLSDEELAAQLQAEYLQETLRDMEDFRLAKLLGGIVDDDELCCDRTTMECRRALLASSIKLGLPGPSKACSSLDKELYVPCFRFHLPHSIHLHQKPSR